MCLNKKKYLYTYYIFSYTKFTYLLLICFRSLAVGTKTGYRLYSLSSVDNLDQIYENGKIH